VPPEGVERILPFVRTRHLDDGETFVEDEAVLALEDSEFPRLGRQFEHHPFFLRRVNTESSPPFSRDRLHGCGSAAQVKHWPAAWHLRRAGAAVLTGRAERRAMPEFRAGKLRIEWREQGAKVASHVMMTGEALKVFSGEVGVGDGELVPVVA